MEMTITTYVSVGVVREVYLTNLNILFNQTLTFFLKIHKKETMLDTRKYLWRLFSKVSALKEFKSA
jgi:hypothetical protein